MLQVSIWHFVKTGQKKYREKDFYNVQFLDKEQVIPHHQLHSAGSITSLSRYYKNNTFYG